MDQPAELFLPAGSSVELSGKLVAQWHSLRTLIAEREANPEANAAELSALRESLTLTDRAIWALEAKIMTDLILTHEGLAAVLPLLESAYASSLKAGTVNNFNQFLVATLGRADGIRPNPTRVVACQMESAESLGIALEF